MGESIKVIRASKGFVRINFRELWRYKDLLYYMVLRDITVIYKQSVLGFAWAVINPLFSMLVFSIVFGILAGIKPSGNIPYPLFSYAAVLPWTYFSNALNASGSSLVVNTSIFTKVYFPRIIIPLTPILSKLVDFAISFILFILLMLFFGYYPNINFLILPIILLQLILTTSGLGMLTASLALQYRDVKFALTFVIPLLMYAAPVVFPAQLILDKFGMTAYLVYGLYPLAGVIESFRAMVSPELKIPFDLLGVGFITSVVTLLMGLRTFGKMERRFADIA